MDKFVFPDYDPEAQLVAISEVIRSLDKVLETKERTFNETNYSNLNPDYAGDMYAGDLHELGFIETAVSHSAIAVIAPFLEGLFRHEIAALYDNGYKSKPEHQGIPEQCKSYKKGHGSLIRHCLAKLRQIMPGLKQPLSEVRISLVADQLILGKNRRRFTPEGQLFIDFTGGESAPVTPASDASGELFFQDPVFLFTAIRYSLSLFSS